MLVVVVVIVVVVVLASSSIVVIVATIIITTTIATATVAVAADVRLTHGVAGVGRSMRHARRKMAEKLSFAQSSQTPYGRVLKSFEIEAEGKPLEVSYLCPHAWLYLLCERSPPFAKFLLAALGPGMAGSMALYTDEVTPGNPMRPDRGRQFLCVYWAIPEFPDWFRSRSGWWQTLLYLPCSALKKIQGKLSALYVKLLQCFWGAGGFDMLSLGIRIVYQNTLVHLNFSFAFFLSDEKAEKEALGVKGAAGYKMCVSCQNAVKCKDRILAGSEMVHYTCSDMSRFVPHTEASIRHVIEELGQAEQNMTPKQFKDAQKSVGVNYADAHLLRSDMAGVARVPHSRYVDWFHNLVASGGIFQYQVNQLMHELQKLGISTSDVDDFPVVQPKDHKLRVNFFKDRVKKGVTKPMKVCLLLILPLLLLIQLVLYVFCCY